MLRKLFWFIVIMLIPLSLVGGAALVWGYYYITRDLPRIETLADFRPPAVTTVHATDGTLIAEFYTQRRYPVKLKEVPLFARNAFLAAEDASFYSHPGIDFFSILRAVLKNLRTGAMKQGGSTITQQVVKNLLLTPEKKFTRKIKEALLSYQIEQQLTKDDILELYLNQIFFGNGAYGIRAAVRIYFHKELAQLTLAEAAMLAGLPKAPSRYSPLANYEAATKRQHYVLDQMAKSGFVTPEAVTVALQEKVQVYPVSSENVFAAPYFVGEVRRVLAERWKDLSIDSDGLRIDTTLDLTADRAAQRALRAGLREVDKRRGWRGPIDHFAQADRNAYRGKYHLSDDAEWTPETVYPALVLGTSSAPGLMRVLVGTVEGVVDVSGEWARKRLSRDEQIAFGKPEAQIRPGDVIEVVPAERPANVPPVKPLEPRFVLDQTPDIEGAVTILDPHSGRVVAMIGGYDYRRSQFNRVTQSYRQPGSSFKPILYLAAVDGFQYTPATIVYDTPRTFRVGEDVWSPGNFDEEFLGPITLQTALEKSRNLVSADIISRIGVDAVIQYARKLGIESPLGQNLSLSLGSSEVTLLELTRAYGVFAAKGVRFNSVLISKITDRLGRVLYDEEAERLSRAVPAVSEQSAFILAHMMKGVVERGTATRVRALGRPVAGKTGTSNDQMDAWFIGYTPNWTCGVWLGFDVKKQIGDKETGGKIAAPVFLNSMKEFLDQQDKLQFDRQVAEARAEAERLGVEYAPPEPLPPIDFSVPEGVDPFWMNRHTGLLAQPNEADAILEYFATGTEPPSQPTEVRTSYLESPEL